MSLYLGSQSGLPPFISATARGTGSASSSDVVVLKDHTCAILAGGSTPGTGLQLNRPMDRQSARRAVAQTTVASENSKKDTGLLRGC